MKIKLLLTSIFLTAFVFSVSSESCWEGSASMSRYGEFPVNGLYGASNSFPLNTIVEVTNPVNNKKAEVIISDTLDDNSIFILLSKDAAGKLKIKEDDIITVKAKIVKKYKNNNNHERELTDDPDFNPAAALLFGDSMEKTPEMNPVETLEEENTKKPYRGKDLADEIIETFIISNMPKIADTPKTSDIPVEVNVSETVETPKEENIPEEVETPEEAEDPEAVETLEEAENSETVETPEEEVLPDAEEEEALEEKVFEKYEADDIDEAENLVEDESSEINEFEEKLVLVPSAPKPPEESYPDLETEEETAAEEMSSMDNVKSSVSYGSTVKYVK